MNNGLFITIEGPDGAGKSTQIEFIRTFLLSRGIDALFTREPGGTPISEKIRRIILDKKNTEMAPMTEALLYAAARAQHVEQVIRPTLRRGKTVVCDRYVDSSIAYQGYGRHLGEGVSIINDYAIAGCIPDITFLLKIEPSTAKNRIRSEDHDRLEAEADVFHMDVYNGYLALEKKYPDRIVGIEADRDIDLISTEIGDYLSRLLLERESASK
jgi:dTMP kinase